MIYSCCTSINNYDLLVKTGYNRIILSATDIALMDPDTFEQLSKTLANGPVKCRALNKFCTPDLVLCGEGFSIEAVTAYIRLLAGRAAQIGVRYIGIGASDSRNFRDGFPREIAAAQLKLSLTEISRVCSGYDIEALIEPVCDLECNNITTTDEALALIEELEISNLNIVFDTYHAFMMGEDDAPLRRAMKYVKLVHIAQNIDGRRHYLRQENIDEYRVYTRALLENGYDDEISVEAFFGEPELELAGTLEIMKRLCS
jgi:sugar phosphate isomerase/epimerase